MKFSLVIPCFNEADNIPLLLNRCKKIAENKDIEVILVDNGSNDSTPHVLKELLPDFPGVRSIRVDNNQGYGYGILKGLDVAEGEIIGWTHADMQTDPQDILEGLTFFKGDCSGVFVKGQRYGRPMVDVLFTIGMSFFESILLKKPFWDINAQPTMFPKAFFEKWCSPPHDFSLDLYAYYMAHNSGLKVMRFPVNFGERAHGTSSWNVDWEGKKKFIKRTIDFSLELKKRVKNADHNA